jgi:hypothetical protein
MEGLELVDALGIERAKLGDCRTLSLPRFDDEHLC